MAFDKITVKFRYVNGCLDLETQVPQPFACVRMGFHLMMSIIDMINKGVLRCSCSTQDITVEERS